MSDFKDKYYLVLDKKFELEQRIEDLERQLVAQTQGASSLRINSETQVRIQTLEQQNQELTRRLNDAQERIEALETEKRDITTQLNDTQTTALAAAKRLDEEQREL